MEFLEWHYSEGILFYLRSWLATFHYIDHFYSIPLFAKTLFAPYKRIYLAEETGRFDFGKQFEVLSFNFVSRFIGALVRIVLMLTALCLYAAGVVGGLLGFVFWLAIPFLSIPIYNKYKRQPAHIVWHIMQSLHNTHKNPIETLFNNDAGRYVLAHLNLTLEEMISNSDISNLVLEEVTANDYRELITYFLEHGAWSHDFLFSKGIDAKDIAIVAGQWDKKRTVETKLTPEEFGRPAIALELTFGYTPTFKEYAKDLTKSVPYSHHLIGRKEIVERIERSLSSGMSVFLTGDPGVGKKTVVLEFARRAMTGQLGHDLSYAHVFEFDYTALLAKGTDLNQKKVELTQVLAEAAASGNTILMIKDLYRLITPEIEGIDFTDVLENLLEKRNLHIIAIASNIEYERFIVPNPRIKKFFDRIEAVPPSQEEAMQILLIAADRWEVLTGMTIYFQSLKQMISKSDEFVTEVPFPEKVLEILDSTVTYAQKKGKMVVELDDVNAVLSEKTGISFARLDQTEMSKLGNLEELIHQRLVNQDISVRLIAKTLRSKTLGVIKEKRPIGSFLFLGPTGVGKTETAKVLAQVYFGSATEIIRFDMAEYIGSEGMERLVGSVSKNLPGNLTTAIKNKPASLLLLDEMEKASPEIYNLFLTMLDEGFITDAFGKQINCKNVFIIATSNAGAEHIRELVNNNIRGEELQQAVVNYVLEGGLFSPEFLNRFDGVVVYEPLTHEDLVEVAKHMLDDLKLNLATRNIHLTVDETAAQKLATDGFDPAFGARPMRRIVNLELGDLLGKGILNGEIREGDHIELSADDEFRWSK